jgi:hypothetical protein
MNFWKNSKLMNTCYVLRERSQINNIAQADQFSAQYTGDYACKGQVFILASNEMQISSVPNTLEIMHVRARYLSLPAMKCLTEKN